MVTSSAKSQMMIADKKMRKIVGGKDTDGLFL